MTDDNTGKWDLIITPDRHLFDFNFKELWDFRDLLYMFVRRDLVTTYKQTILGPAWHFAQPLFTMLVYVIVFGGIAKLPTDGIPQPVFYLSGIIMWNFFIVCFEQTSDTFYQNAAIFGKAYFPRLLIPIAKVIFGLFRFFIQSFLFLAIYFYFLIRGADISPNISILLTPYLILLMAGLGLGGGMIFSSITAKYRDLKFFITFGIQLLMFITPVIYPMSIIPDKFRFLVIWNPIAHIIESFKFAYLGAGEFTLSGLLYATMITVIALIIGVILYNITAKNFMDTV